MKTSAPARKPSDQAQAARARLAAAKDKLAALKKLAKAAKQKRKEAKQAHRLARDKVRLAKAELADARAALDKASQHSGSRRTAPAKATPSRFIRKRRAAIIETTPEPPKPVSEATAEEFDVPPPAQVAAPLKPVADDATPPFPILPDGNPS